MKPTTYNIHYRHVRTSIILRLGDVLRAKDERIQSMRILYLQYFYLTSANEKGVVICLGRGIGGEFLVRGSERECGNTYGCCG